MSAMAFQQDTPERVASALSILDAGDRELWVRMAFAVKDALGEAGRDVWLDWSRTADNFDERAALATWKSSKAGGAVRAGTLFFEARQRGWHDDARPVQVDPAEAERRRVERAERDARAAAELEAQRAAAAERAAAIWGAAEPAVSHPYLDAKGILSHGTRVGRWDVVDRATGEVKTLDERALLIPAQDFDGRIWTLECILTEPLPDGRNKLFLRGGAKSGHFFRIGDRPVERHGRPIFVVSEGFATGASIHECTRHQVIVCFDAGNLAPVARELRVRHPEAVILLAADNDQFGARNSGMEAARKAAAEVGGLVALPEFADLDGNPTDFNDLHQREGAIAVIEQIVAGLKSEPIVPEPAAAPVAGDALLADFEQAMDETSAGGAGAPERAPDPADHDDDIWNNPNFRILGHKRKSYFFYQCGKRQVLEYAGRELSTTASLIELAPLDWWKQRYPGGSGGIDRDAAFNALVRIAEQRGVYDDTRRRGCGAWWDRGRFVVHLGDRLLVDGLVVPLGDIKSAYVYEAAPLFAEIGDVPLSSEEGGRLLEIAKRFRWEKAVSADLLCGWVFLAPICGALKWRPHVWLTGSAGSGKTTLVADFAHKLIPEGVTVFGNGDSSEAGFRQELDSNARPIMIDESESDDLKARSRVEDVIAMLRQSSSDSGAKTYRGTAGGKSMSFLVRSMAMLSSIGVALKQQQDVERIAVLALKSKRDDDGAAADWPAIKAGLRWIAEDGLISERVFRRAIDMIQTISEAIDRFSEAIADHEAFGTQRHGDQYGTLLAGCWCLTHDRAPSVEEAAGVVAGHDWGEHQAKHGEEPEELMATLLGCPVVLERGVRTSIGVLIAIAAGRPAEDERLGDLTHREANAQLHTYGMKVTAGVLRVHPSNKQLEQLLAGTKFAAGLHERMKRVKGADTWGGRTFRIGEASKNGVHIPIDTVFAASDEEAMASSGAARPLPVPAPF